MGFSGVVVESFFVVFGLPQVGDDACNILSSLQVSGIAQGYWAELMPCVLLAHNTSLNATMREHLFFVRARLAICIIWCAQHI